MGRRFTIAITLLAVAGVIFADGPCSAYFCKIADLGKVPAPPNPVTICGKIVSTSPAQLSDGSGTINVVGLTVDTTAYVTAKGNWDGNVLTVQDTVPYSTPPTSGEQRDFLLPTGGTIPMIYVSAGAFLMGNNGSEPAVCPDELPQRSVAVSGYWIGKYPVRRGEYRRFIEAGGYANAAYWSAAGLAWRGSKSVPRYWDPAQNWGAAPGSFTQTDDHPIVGVSYYEAEAFCNWAGDALPSEAQWEKAARWDPTTDHANVYPWGDARDLEKCNNWDDTLYAGSQTSPVGSYPSGASPYGCLDMSGNVWQWCQDWYNNYPGSTTPFDNTGVSRVLRGGSWSTSDLDCRSAFRHGFNIYPSDQKCYFGFRVAR